MEFSIHPYPYIRKWVFPGRLCNFLISGGYFTVQGLISYVKFLKYKTRFKYKNLGHSPYGPWPIWAKANMGQGPYGPGPIWARAHMGPGPLGPGPFLVGQTPHQKTHPGKKSPNCVFCVFFGNKKDARRPYDHFGGGIAPRSLLCVRKRRFPFLKKGRNLVRNLPS